MKAKEDAKGGHDARSEGLDTLLSLVVPVLNESDAVGYFVDRVTEVFPPSSQITVEVVFVNDGSSDDTLARVLELQASSRLCIKLVDLSRNFGKEAALSAGLRYARGEVVVPIDVDLQDPPELIPRMIEKWREGYEVVVGKRATRDTDTWPKRASSDLFYRVHNLISSPPIPPNVGDFRLMDRSVVDALLELPESRRFTKGLFAWIGFRTTCIEYARQQRVAGKTKFNGWKLWNFALEGLTSFSTVPLRMWTYIGLLVSLASFAFGVFIALRVVVSGVDVPGYASLMVAVTFLGGLQLIGIGVLGEYLGRTYIESKRRPTYVVRKTYDAEA